MSRTQKSKKIVTAPTKPSLVDRFANFLGVEERTYLQNVDEHDTAPWPVDPYPKIRNLRLEGREKVARAHLQRVLDKFPTNPSLDVIRLFDRITDQFRFFDNAVKDALDVGEHRRGSSMDFASIRRWIVSPDRPANYTGMLERSIEMAGIFQREAESLLAHV